MQLALLATATQNVFVAVSKMTNQAISTLLIPFNSFSKNAQKWTSNFLTVLNWILAWPTFPFHERQWKTDYLCDVRSGSIPLLVPIDPAGTRGNAFADLGVWSRGLSWAAKGFVGRRSDHRILSKSRFLCRSAVKWERGRLSDWKMRELREIISHECKLFLFASESARRKYDQKRGNEYLQ